jgi:hypothetical protein
LWVGQAGAPCQKPFCAQGRERRNDRELLLNLSICARNRRSSKNALHAAGRPLLEIESADEYEVKAKMFQRREDHERHKKVWSKLNQRNRYLGHQSRHLH